jgi:hypothetical protein
MKWDYLKSWRMGTVKVQTRNWEMPKRLSTYYYILFTLYLVSFFSENGILGVWSSCHLFMVIQMDNFRNLGY